MLKLLILLNTIKSFKTYPKKLFSLISDHIYVEMYEDDFSTLFTKDDWRPISFHMEPNGVQRKRVLIHL